MIKEFGTLTKEEYKHQFRVNNALSFSNPSNFGLEQNITTLTRILEGVQRQKFYTLAGQSLTDFIPIEQGTGAYGKNIMQYTVAQVGASFEAGIIQPGNGMNKDANVDIVIDEIQIKNNYWRMKYQATKEIVEMSRVNAQTFSYIEEQEIARLKTWQLGLQRVAFLGTSDGLNHGLLNLPDVTVNTSLMPATFANMTIEQLNNFAITVVNTYFTNTNSTVFPNTLVIPTADLGALGTPINPEYPIGTRRQYLEDAFKAAGAPADFRILHTVYNNTAGTGGTGRYVLYNRDADTLTMYIPKPYTPYPLYPTGSLDMISDAEGQFTGVFAKRPKEIMYMDVTA
ncbi:DUF2184 domain-containing protein [bacterium]|nr:DUF2184 domain-containing protein [bacterium]